MLKCRRLLAKSEFHALHIYIPCTCIHMSVYMCVYVHMDIYDRIHVCICAYGYIYI